jgi:N-acetylglutamate synthase
VCDATELISNALWECHETFFNSSGCGYPAFCRLNQSKTFMFSIRTMTIDDYEKVIALMKRTPGVTFRDADSQEKTASYLLRNSGLSFIAIEEGNVVGCIMSGHDGRRGYLQHLVVQLEHRRKGIANALVDSCISALEKLGINKSHIDVLNENEAGISFWESQGWKLRTDIKRYSFVRSGGENV